MPRRTNSALKQNSNSKKAKITTVAFSAGKMVETVKVMIRFILAGSVRAGFLG